MARETKQQYVTKKHLARLERERRQTLLILIGSIAVVLIVFLLIGYGILNEKVLKPRRPVAIVGSEKVSAIDFQEYARFMRQQYVNQYVQTYQFSQLFGSDESTKAYFDNSLSQIEAALEPTTLGQNVLNALIEDKLIRQEAAKRGITVSSSDLDKDVERYFSYYPNGTPTATATFVPQPTSTLSPLQMTLVPPTATPTASPTPTQTLPTATPTQELTPTQVLTPTLTATPAPTATPYTVDAFKTDYDNYVKELADLKVSEAIFRKVLENRLYRLKVEEAILADVKNEEEQIWTRHILVDTEEAAKEVRARLENGEDFAALAQELSIDPGSASDGGNLGWTSTGTLVAEFEAAANALSIGEISQPVQTTNGWHIIQLLGKEIRPLDSYSFEQLRQTKFQEWLDSQRTSVGVDIPDGWLDWVPTEPTLPALQ
jgi:peptidyl-prolyl cis-trans isomerase D